MRPVKRGPCPVDSAGNAMVFGEYNDARPHLIGRMGDYCSFCEMHLPNPAVEHIRCKDTNTDLEREWSNFLIACPNCNSIKGTRIDTQNDVDRHLWPHLHRTFDVFVHESGGIVRLAEIADSVLADRARATEELVGLTRRPGHPKMKTYQIRRGSDRRWEKRREAWQEAVQARNDLRKNDTPAMRRLVLSSARARGFWSVWMTVFRDDASMRAALCEAFPGTANHRVFPPSPATPAPGDPP